MIKNTFKMQEFYIKRDNIKSCWIFFLSQHRLNPARPIVVWSFGDSLNSTKNASKRSSKCAYSRQSLEPWRFSNQQTSLSFLSLIHFRLSQNSTQNRSSHLPAAQNSNSQVQNPSTLRLFWITWPKRFKVVFCQEEKFSSVKNKFRVNKDRKR